MNIFLLAVEAMQLLYQTWLFLMRKNVPLSYLDSKQDSGKAWSMRGWRSTSLSITGNDMFYSLDPRCTLCKTCSLQIALFGAHRGGVYCQAPDKPCIIGIQVTSCSRYCFDHGERHKQMFDIDLYPGLLTWRDKDNIDRLKKEYPKEK